MTDVIARLLESGEDRKMVDERQAFRLPLIADLLRSLGVPDCLFEQLREGVPLGVNCELPRTPEVFEEKLTWAFDEMSDPLEKPRTIARCLRRRLLMGGWSRCRTNKRKPSSERTSTLQRS